MRTTNFDIVDEYGISSTKNNLKIHLNRIKEEIMVSYLVGKKEKRIGDWMSWEWFSTGYIEPILTNECFESTINEGKELKGYIVYNKNGDILTSDFSPFIEKINVRMNIKIQSTKESSIVEAVEKFSIGLPDLLNDMIPLEILYFPFNDENKLRKYLTTYLEDVTRYEPQTIRVIEPYLSLELLEMLDKAIDQSTNIHILTTTLSSKKDEHKIISKLKGFLDTNRKIQVKQIRRKNQKANIKNKIANPFHDRAIIHNNGGIIIGISMSGLAKNSTYVVNYKDGRSIITLFDKWFNNHLVSYQGKDLCFKDYFP